MTGKYCKLHGWVAVNYDCDGANCANSTYKRKESKMKRIFTLLMVLLVVLVSVAFGADAVPVVAPAAPTVSTFQGIINWMVGNQVIVGILLAAILDFIFAINPAWKSNGALHFIYTLVQKKAEPTPPTA